MTEKCLPYLPDYHLVDGYRVPSCFSEETVRSAFSYRPQTGEVVLACYPKSGSTWSQMILYLIYKNGKPPSKTEDFRGTVPCVELAGADAAEKNVSPRCCKTHLPFDRITFCPNAKYLHLVRNPKDLCVSFFHHTRSPAYNYHHGNFDQFFDLFINGQTDFGDWFDHVLGWFEHRNDANVMHLKYEELKKDTADSILKIAEFIGKEYRSNLEKDPQVLSDIIRYSSVEYMKSWLNDGFDGMVDFCLKSKSEGIDSTSMSKGEKHFWKYIAEHDAPSTEERFHIIRKGITGDWTSLFSDDQAKRMDRKIEDRLRGTELYEYWKSNGYI